MRCSSAVGSCPGRSVRRTRPRANDDNGYIDSGIIVKKRASVTAADRRWEEAGINLSMLVGRQRHDGTTHDTTPGTRVLRTRSLNSIPARIYPDAEDGSFIVPSLRHDAKRGYHTRRRRRTMPMVDQRHKKQMAQSVPPLSSFLFLFPPFSLFPFFFSFSFARYYCSTSTKFEPGWAPSFCWWSF